MTHIDTKDPSWRTGAIFRTCVRQGQDQDWAREQLAGVYDAVAADRLSTIWFRRHPIFVAPEHAEAYRNDPETHAHLVVGWHPSTVDRAREDYAAHLEALERENATADDSMEMMP